MGHGRTVRVRRIPLAVVRRVDSGRHVRRRMEGQHPEVPGRSPVPAGFRTVPARLRGQVRARPVHRGCAGSSDGRGARGEVKQRGTPQTQHRTERAGLQKKPQSAHRRVALPEGRDVAARPPVTLVRIYGANASTDVACVGSPADHRACYPGQPPPSPCLARKIEFTSPPRTLRPATGPHRVFQAFGI